MKINYLVLFLVVFLAGQATFAQESFKEKHYETDVQDFQSFVNEAYGDKAQEFVFNREIRSAILKNALKDRIWIKENGPGIDVPNRFPELSSVGKLNYNTNAQPSGSFDPDTFNPFFYKLNFNNTEDKEFYHVDGTQFYIVILPLSIERINELRN